MRESKVVTIDGESFRIGTFPPMKAMNILTRLLKMGEKSFSKFANLAPKKDQKNSEDIDLSNIDMEDVGEALSSILENVDEHKVNKLFSDVLAQCHHEGNDESQGFGNCQKNIDAIFMGKPFLMVKVVGAILKENFEDFLPAGAQLSNLGTMKAQKK